MGHHQSHDTLRRILADQQPCKILDAACGQGALTEYLNDLGWDVSSADIYPELCRVEGITPLKVNLNRALPYKDNQFDAIVCANAIHRLFNPAGAMREFSRILRPGGKLYLNTNNYATIEHRLRFLLTGSIDYRDPSIEEGIVPQAEPEGYVRVRIMFPQILQCLKAAGFELKGVKETRPYLTHNWLKPVASLVRFGSKLFKRFQIEGLEYTNASPILTGGYYYLILAEKVSDPLYVLADGN